MRRIHSLPTLIVLAAVAACDAAGASANPDEDRNYGYDDASSADMAAIPRALAASDLDGVRARGLILWKMARALRLGDREFAGFVGVSSAKFQALVSLDPGERSGEVAYYRWDAADLDDGEATADEALRWLVVSVTLDPDEALAPQELNLEPTPEQTRTLAAVAAAERRAAVDYPGARWVAYGFREQQVVDGVVTGARQTRVYLLGADERSPDLELTVVDPGKRRQPPVVTASVLQLPAGASAKLPLATPAQAPGPSTIARAVAIATATGEPAAIVDASGQRWSVAPGTGGLTRE